MKKFSELQEFVEKRTCVKVGIYNDDRFLGQNLLITPLINELGAIFENDCLIYIIAPQEIHEFWLNSIYNIALYNLAEECEIDFDIFLALTHKRSFLISPPKISTKVLIAENFHDNTAYWDSHIVFNYSFDLAEFAANKKLDDMYLAHRYIIYATPWMTKLLINNEPALNYPIKEENISSVLRYFKNNDIYSMSKIFLNLGGISNSTWRDHNKYIELARKVLTNLNVCLILNNGPNEIDINSKFILELDAYKDRIYLPKNEKFDINQTAAIIKSCQLVVTKDTGIFHLANAVGSNTIVFTHYYADHKLWLFPAKNIKIIMSSNECTDPGIDEIFNEIKNSIL
ncbi:MAG: hypothetical protein KKA84_00895 [Bacteroidetes bacterium]|nr:hypothetical protein [Bacteroidota bacterium]